MLDAQGEKSARADAPNKRITDRHTYRVRELTVEFIFPDGSYAQSNCPSRNISGSGIGILSDAFYYPNTPCRVHLVTLQNQRFVVNGRVARCRYLPGSAGLHEVGIRFERRIDVALFNRQGPRLRMLIGEADPIMQRLLKTLSRAVCREYLITQTVEEFVLALNAADFDVALFSKGLPPGNVLEEVVKVRSAGCATAIVAMSGEEDPVPVDDCYAAGCSAFVPKPLTKEGIAIMAQAAVRDPVISSASGLPGADTKLIDEFASGLEAHIREWEKCFAERNWAQLRNHMTCIALEANAASFEIIENAAQAVSAKLQGDVSAADMRPAFNELARLCHAARPVQCFEV
ncbi:MAG: PilZ domain-containing protein [Phycisphaerales bacterium]|nr:PilZ domain-containing protein [Phycisphaerales bacterium]